MKLRKRSKYQRKMTKIAQQAIRRPARRAVAAASSRSRSEEELGSNSIVTAPQAVLPTVPEISPLPVEETIQPIIEQEPAEAEELAESNSIVTDSQEIVPTKSKRRRNRKARTRQAAAASSRSKEAEELSESNPVVTAVLQSSSLPVEATVRRIIKQEPAEAEEEFEDYAITTDNPVSTGEMNSSQTPRRQSTRKMKKTARLKDYEEVKASRKPKTLTAEVVEDEAELSVPEPSSSSQVRRTSTRLANRLVESALTLVKSKPAIQSNGVTKKNRKKTSTNAQENATPLTSQAIVPIKPALPAAVLINSTWEIKEKTQESSDSWKRLSLRKVKEGTLDAGTSSSSSQTQQLVEPANAYIARPTGKKLAWWKWFPGDEEQAELYKNRSFLIEADQDSKPPLDTTLWRIFARDGIVSLQKYSSKDMNGRVFHFATAEFQIYKEKDQAFFIKYRPAFVVVIHDTDLVKVVQYFNVDRILPHFLHIRTTQGLLYHYKVLIHAITMELVTWPPGFIKSRVSSKSAQCDEYFKSSWDAIEYAVNNRVKAIVKAAGPRAKISPFRIFPDIKIMSHKRSDITDLIACAFCKKSNSTPTWFKAIFDGRAYDRLTFENRPNNLKQKDLYFCYSCEHFIRIINRLLNHNWRMYRVIRANITDYTQELGPNQRLCPIDVVNVFIKDYEWCLKCFLEFQVVLAEADQVIEKLKNTKR